MTVATPWLRAAERRFARVVRVVRAHRSADILEEPITLTSTAGYQLSAHVHRPLQGGPLPAVVLCPGEIIEVSDLTLSSIAPAGDSDVLPAAGGEYQALTIAEVERIHIMATLEQNNWNKSRSAGVLGIERSTLDRKINRYEIVPQNKS